MMRVREMVWLMLFLLAPPAYPQGEAPAAIPAGLPTVAAKTAGLEARRGLLTFYADHERGKLYLAVPKPAAADGVVAELLYYEGITTGLGSNPIGLDRGALGAGRVVRLRRLGGRLLIEEVNPRFRALTADPVEARAVEESFATSILWGGELAAVDADGAALVDFTSFLLRDAHGIAAAIRRAGQGSYAVDPARSALDLASCLAFPDNVELEALLTFTSTEPGPLVRSILPSPDAVTLLAHHSFVRLPEPGYRPRAFDPRAGSSAIRFNDYASAISEPIEKRWIVRFRLEKTDPAAARSRVRKPIVFYVDRGAPEPIRTALKEGASWWARAFEAAGFIDAYKVEILPEGAHPLDLSYNVIQWVHRSTRGWSYGGGIVDPRTGEQLKGHVTLGSLRVRQDRLLFEGLLGADLTGKGGAADPAALALWRIRQLAAHEVGHALGFQHNFAASTYDDRASVMDYPAPRVDITPAGELDLSRAYGVGVGSWDLHAVRYAYSEFPPGADEGRELGQIIEEGLAKGLLMITDNDARPLGSAHPLAHLWDNGPDPAAMLEHEMKVRAIALSRFGRHNLAAGQPLALLEEVFATVYLHHRYQLEAAVKLVGGVDYRYGVNGDRQPGARAVDAAWQRRALAAVLSTLEPAALDIPEAVAELLLPRPAEYDPNPELFGSATAPVFDTLGAAATAADLAVAGLLEPSRAARLVDQGRREAGQLGLTEVLRALLAAVSARPPGEGERLAELRRHTAEVAVHRLVGLAGDPRAPASVRGRVEAELERFMEELRAKRGEGPERAHRSALLAELERFRRRDWSAAGPAAEPLPAPPGMPIGAALGAAEAEGCSQGVADGD